MAYRKPEILVYQRVMSTPAPNVVYLLPHISGGDAQLILYDNTTTKKQGSIGTYAGAEGSYLWPNRLPDGIIDIEYSKLFVENGTFLYAETDDTADTLNLDNGNLFTSDTLQFASNTDGNARSPIFKGRDVQAGDVVQLSVVHSSLGLYELTSEVVRTLPEGIAGSADPVVTSDAGNAPTSTASVLAVKTGSASTTTATAAGTYDGRVAGLTSDTYTVRVIRSSTSNDPTTARLQVTTASGTDQADSIIPAAYGAVFNIGSRGLTLTLSGTGNLLIGDVWTIEAVAAFTVPTVTADTSYNGNKTTTYVVSVSRGGDLGSAVLQAAAVDGTDRRVDIQTTASGDVDLQSGLRIHITASKGLVTNDKFYISTTGANSNAGPINRIILRTGLPSEYVTTGSVTVTDAKFYIRQNIEIPKVSSLGGTNWEAFDDMLTITGQVYADIPGVAVSGGAEPCRLVALDGFNDLYVEYRNWLASYSTSVYSIASMDDLNALLPGIIHPDNPLKYALSCSLASLAQDVVSQLTFTSVVDPASADSWRDVLSVISNSADCYNLVPLTHDREVLQAFVDHANQMSQVTIGAERVVWVNEELPRVIRILPNDTMAAAQAVIVENTFLNNGQFNELQVTTAGVDLLELGVRAGDIVRYNFAFDVNGEIVYRTARITQVLNANAVLIDVDFNTIVSVPFQIELWHTRTDMDIAEQASKTLGFKDRRVRYLFPDEVVIGTNVVSGTVGCAVIATLSSSVVPQQGLTRYPLTGITSVPKSISMSRTALDTMAENGVWILTQDLTGSPYTRHALTTGVASGLLEDKEEMCVRNMDSCTKFIRNGMTGYVGITNIVDSNIVAISAQMKNLTIQLQNNYYTEALGGQLVSAASPQVTRNAIYRDTLDIIQECVIPAPLNNINVYLYYTTQIES